MCFIVLERNLRFLKTSDQDEIQETFRKFPVHKRKPLRRDSAIVDEPSQANLRRWRAAQRDGIQEAVQGGRRVAFGDRTTVEVDHLLHLPEWIDTSALDQGTRNQTRIQPEQDPIKLVDALGVLQHLRGPTMFSELLDDAGEYLAANDSLIVRRRDEDPARSSLQRALSRADIVALNLERRRFHHWQQHDLIKSLHLFSDASPVVGHELQGMLIDVVLRDRSVVQMVLAWIYIGLRAHGHFF